jgi:hypothetical protein
MARPSWPSLSVRRIDSELQREPAHVGRLVTRVQEVAAITNGFLPSASRHDQVVIF